MANRYARAQARARYRKPKRRGGSFGWNVAIGVIVILGIGGIVLSRTVSKGGGLEVGDHWHSALGVSVCGTYEEPQGEFTAKGGGVYSEGQPIDQYAGIHTHSDGIIHMEPASKIDTGSRATIGLFAEYGGWELSSDSFTTWNGQARSNGDLCPAPDGTQVPGTVTWAVDGKEKKGNPADHHMKDGEVIVIAFLPEGQTAADLDAPPSAAELPNAAQNEGGGTIPPNQ